MKPRATARLKAKLERNLLAYATVATAAGIGATITPAEAKVVYTPLQFVVEFPDSGYALDLDRDGKPEFFIGRTQSCHSDGCDSIVLAAPTTSNMQGIEFKGRSLSAGAMVWGAQIGQKRGFHSKRVPRAYLASAFYSKYKSSTGEPLRGHWINAHGRFLGLKFQINGKTHYGWCRMNVFQQGVPIRHFKVKITGYAYETIPDKPIVAGDKGTGASLGHLALGAPRRK